MMTKTKTTRPKQIKVKATSKSDGTRKPSPAEAIEQEIARSKKLRASTLEESEREKKKVLAKATFNSLRIAAATGDTDAKRRIAENDSKTRQLAESQSLIGAIDEQLPVLEKKRESAFRNQWREEREELAEKNSKVTKEIAQHLDKAARKSTEFLDGDGQISALTRQLGETPGATPKQKLFAEICRHFHPILGSHFIKRAAYKGSLVEWASRFRGSTGAS